MSKFYGMFLSAVLSLSFGSERCNAADATNSDAVEGEGSFVYLGDYGEDNGYEQDAKDKRLHKPPQPGYLAQAAHAAYWAGSLVVTMPSWAIGLMRDNEATSELKKILSVNYHHGAQALETCLQQFFAWYQQETVSDDSDQAERRLALEKNTKLLQWYIEYLEVYAQVNPPAAINIQSLEGLERRFDRYLTIKPQEETPHATLVERRTRIMKEYLARNQKKTSLRNALRQTFENYDNVCKQSKKSSDDVTWKKVCEENARTFLWYILDMEALEGIRTDFDVVDEAVTAIKLSIHNGKSDAALKQVIAIFDRDIKPQRR